MDFQNDEWYYNDDNQAIVLPTVPYRCVQIATYTDELGMKHTAYLLFLPEMPRGQLFPTLYNQIIGEQGMLMYGRLGWVPSRFVVEHLKPTFQFNYDRENDFRCLCNIRFSCRPTVVNAHGVVTLN